MTTGVKFANFKVVEMGCLTPLRVCEEIFLCRYVYESIYICVFACLHGQASVFILCLLLARGLAALSAAAVGVGSVWMSLFACVCVRLWLSLYSP
jgi:hypothetical protein